MTDQEQEHDETIQAEQQRPFTQWLLEQRTGGLHAELTEKLAEVVKAVMDEQKPGALTLVITLRPMENGVNVMVSDDIKTKIPRPSNPAALFYADGAGNLSRRDPRQPELPLRELGQPRKAS